MSARAYTESTKRLAKSTLVRDAALHPEQPGVDYHRPRMLSECDAVGLGTVFPCPFVSCKYHLCLDVNPKSGSIKHNFPGRDVDEIPATCSLRVAAEGSRTLDEVAKTMNMTRERTRQIETRAIERIRRNATQVDWAVMNDALDHFEENPK